ncbi:DegT/DnrJ/EryC1/StrS family aminotransferase [Aliikangiella coralliicola]|uniref:DegT/DnrJ/EryC1/StrS family aminotransferase n=2 Tax=Aliikangiella coralliicola TaxID=2592383 RepID=A0A545U0N5_9GAMM|nr:DegT/DnrJ/EryC1/StrS family aminotransferase [Aliikangiella coralliicola]
MQMRPLFGEEEKKAICEYMDEDGFITEFKRTQEFEKMIAEFTGAKHCIAVNNGTISLTLAAMAAGVEAGDEVIVPNYTMIASPNSLKMFGAVPVFVDVEESTLCLDINLVEAAITPKTKAIMLVSANGRYPDAGIEQFLALCEKHNLKLIEDSAQSLGSYYPDGTHIGCKGLVGSFSFSAPKIISTGQGGAIITDDDDVALRLRRLKDFGRDGGGTDVHESIGFNFKFTELQACIGIEQMKKLSERVERKKAIFLRYKAGLEGVEQVKLFENNVSTTAPWFYDALVERREDLIAHLKGKGIGSRVMYPPINQQRAYAEDGSYPTSELIGEKGLWLPSAVQLTDEEIDYIIESIKEFY